MLPSPIQQIDPGQAIMKKVLADLSKTTSAQASEALQQGVPLNDILKQLVQMTGSGGQTGGAGGPQGGGPQPPGGGKKQEEAIPQQNQGTAQPTPTANPGGTSDKSYTAEQVLAALMEVQDGMRNQQGMAGPSQAQAQAPAPYKKPGNFLHTPHSINPNTGEVTPESILGGLFKQHPDNVKKQTETALLGQRHAGKAPLQEGERESYGLEVQKGYAAEHNKQKNEFFKKMLQPDAASGEVAKQLNYTNEASDAASQLLEIFGTDPSSLTAAFQNPKSDLVQRISTLSQRLRASLVPARAGATLSKEEKNLIESIANPRGMGAFLKNPSDVKFRLTEIVRSMDRQKGYLDPNSKTKQATKFLLDKGYSKDEVYDALERQGQI